MVMMGVSGVAVIILGVVIVWRVFVFVGRIGVALGWRVLVAEGGTIVDMLLTDGVGEPTGLG
jgi:hypothetical protein